MKKALSLFLSALMVLTLFTVAVPFISAEGELPTIKLLTGGNEGFYEYKSVITKVEFLNSAAVPEDATYVWDVSQNAEEPVKAWLESVTEEEVENGEKVITDATLCIGGEGGVSLNPHSTSLFEGFTAMTEIDFGGCVDTSKVVTMEKMFDSCYSLTSIDLSAFDTGNVNNFNEMFENCSSLTELDLSFLEINNATIIARMMKGCSALETVRIDNWYFGAQLVDMNGLFNGCENLTSIYIYDIGYHGNSKPTQDAVYKNVPSADLKFHDNRNIGTDSELWKRFFDDAKGSELVFDYPEHYNIILNPEKLELLDGQSVTVTATVDPRPNNSNIKWESADKSVATVNKNGVVTAVGVGTTTITVTNTTVDDYITKVDKATLEVNVKQPSSADCYKITFVKPDDIEYFQVSKDGGETYIPVHGGTFEYLKETKLIVKVYGNAISYIYSVNGYEIESDYENRLDVVVNSDKTVSVRAINPPTGEETVSFFERIIQWFRDLFERLFGWLR